MAFVSRPATDGFFVKQHPPSPSAAHCNKSPRQQHTQQQQSKQHSTVAWDRQQVQSQLIKENASLIAPRYHAASLRVSKPFLDGSLSDLGDRKLRGQQRRAPLAAETFIAPRPRHTANQADASYSGTVLLPLPSSMPMPSSALHDHMQHRGSYSLLTAH